MTSQRLAWLLPIALVFLVLGTHLGIRSGCYWMSRPDDRRDQWYIGNATGFAEFQEGVPVAADSEYTRRLGGLFRGEPGRDATSFTDERALVPFLQVLLGAGTVSSLWPGVLVNLIATAAASACAVDLLRRRGRRLSTAVVLGCLFATGRGLACYLGMPDSHMLSYAWMPIGVWLFERLELLDPAAPHERVIVLGLVLGAGLVTYLGTISLLGFVWLYGIGRTSLRRLVAITAIAFATKAGWHVVGELAGLAFRREYGSDISEGLAMFVRHVLGLLGDERSSHARALAGILWPPVLPAFGIPLLASSVLGLVVAPEGERRLAVSVAVPGYVAALPHLTIWGSSAGWIYPASFGLAILAASGIEALGSGAGALALAARAGPRGARRLEALVVVVAIAAFAVVENSDLLGVPSWSFIDSDSRVDVRAVYGRGSGN